MIYQSRKRKYTSRKEKLDNGKRFLQRLLFFAFLCAGILLFFRRQIVWDWIKVFFY